jgi:hypothetical protein
MLRHFWKHKIADPVVDLLRQGVTPEKLALSLGLGIFIGTFPLIGTTTLICILAAVVLRLNLPAIQIANYAVYPLQVLLLVPFMHLGAILFNAETVPLSIDEITAMFADSWWDSVQVLWRSLVHAMVAWLVVWAPVGWICYRILKPLLVRLNAGLHKKMTLLSKPR